jgi:hypothetical protein
MVTSIPDPRSFHVFELFIWIASTVGALRVITGLSCRAVLVSSREKLEGGEKSGMSKWKGLMVLLLGGAFGIFCSLNFKFVANTNAAPFIMRNSLRLFLSLETFVFCTSVIFFAEGILAFVSLALIRGRPD